MPLVRSMFCLEPLRWLFCEMSADLRTTAVEFPEIYHTGVQQGFSRLLFRIIRQAE